MNHFKRFFVMLFCLFFIHPTFFAAGTTPSGESSSEPSVYESMQTDGEQDLESTPPQTTPTEVADTQSPSIFPLFLKFIFSFAVVIGLLLWVMRYLSKRNNVLQTSGPVLPLGGRMLGNNRSVQVILVGQTIYIIGVGEDVNLIRAIPQGEEYQHLLESYENQGDTTSVPLFKKNSTKWNSVFGKHLKKMQRDMDEEQLR